jgi:hypothetical protein
MEKRRVFDPEVLFLRGEGDRPRLDDECKELILSLAMQMIPGQMTSALMALGMDTADATACESYAKDIFDELTYRKVCACFLYCMIGKHADEMQAIQARKQAEDAAPDPGMPPDLG